ncbi:MAG: DUF402 domain-containing protein, partial [Malacoplasma sp.]|nr:DUF402 domain-containing protein [Malacoplasma sp.]
VIAYYVNIASPFIYEEEAIKYYDFDLDIKMRNNSSSTYKILDIDEYKENKKKYRYEKEVMYNCEMTLKMFEKQEFRDNIINSISPKMLAFLYSKKRKV